MGSLGDDCYCDPSHSTTGWLYTIANTSYIFPFTATQCEPFNIFYNNTYGETDFSFFDATPSHILSIITAPEGIGYVDWICNIPAGIGFNVDLVFNYTVQPGSSSACLGDLNTTYSYVSYFTTNFESYTQTASSLITPLPTKNFRPTTSFPTGTYSTIKVNPNLAVTPTTSPPSSSSPVTSSISSPPLTTMSSSLPSPKSPNAPIAGGVVVAAAFVLLILTLVLWWRRRRSALAKASSPIDPQPSSISGLATGQLGSTDPSSTFQFSGAEFLGGTQQYPFSPPDPYSHGTEPTSDNLIVVPVTGNPAALVDPIVGQRPSQGTITPFVAEPVPPSQRPRKPRNGRQASQPGPSPEWPSRTPPTVEQQPPCIQSFNTPADAAPETSRPDAMPLSQQPSMSETQEGPLGFTAVLGVIPHARLSEMERLAAIRNLLGSDPSGQSDLASQNTLSPPSYAE